MHLWIAKFWGNLFPSRVKISPLKQGFLSFIFDCSKDRDSVLQKGPWYFGNVGLNFLPWSEHFDSSIDFHDLQLLWVRLASLPLFIFICAKTLQAIGDVVGKSQLAAPKALERNDVPRNLVLMHTNGGISNWVALRCGDFLWPVDLAYEKISFLYRLCHSIGHILHDFPKQVVAYKKRRDGVLSSSSPVPTIFIEVWILLRRMSSML
jgi:hypothetical protein